MIGDLDKQRQSILIVDDTPEILKFLMKALGDLEYIVTSASSGNMAFNAIETDPPDLILLDINMPGMDGYQVCQRLKTSEAFREIPVIFLTAMHETIDKVKAFEAGGVDYITKPFQMKEVVARVKTHLDIRNLQEQLGKQNLQLQQQIIVRRQTEEELRKHKIHLEELVEERTADLRKINVVLQKEITEREKAAEELKFRNLILSTQQEVSADGILVIDKEGGILSCNKLFIDMWGIPKEVIEKRSDELAVRSVLDKLSDPEKFSERVKYLYEHIEEISHDEIDLKDGRILDRYSAPMIGPDKKYYGRVWFFRDITDRKKAEKVLKEERQRFLILTDEAPFGIVLFNGEGKYTYLNSKFKEIFGYDLNDIPDGRTWLRKAYPDVRYRHKVIETWLSDAEKLEKDVALTEEGKWTFTVTCKDTSEKIVSFITLRLPTGEFLMTCEDITERRKTEEALEKREAELEIKSTNLEEMNAALKVLLKERENDKVELEEKVLSNVRELVLPYIEKLKKSRLDSQHMTYVDIIDTNLNDIVSPFLQKMGLKYANLTPTEIEIANLIKNGKRTKEIGDLLHMSPGAINFHRNNIRKKLGLNNEKVNLRSYLMSLQ